MDNFDRDFKRVQKTILSLWLMNAIIGLAVLAGIGWVVVWFLENFGIVR